jgi:SAM-dependent methyltransferase
MSAINPDYRKWVTDKYNNLDRIWAPNDLWHSRMRDEILATIRRIRTLHPEPFDLVIDLGSGGFTQDIQCRKYIHVDLALRKIQGTACAVCADAHRLPFGNQIADCLVCVGSVINYCSLIEVINEIGRISKPGAMAVLHIELSNSLELLRTPHFRAEATFVKTAYQGEEFIWLYSRRNILATLVNSGFRIAFEVYLHTLTALAHRIVRDRNIAARLATFDRVIGRIPIVGEFADNAIFICVKST